LCALTQYAETRPCLPNMAFAALTSEQ
jgi:hypothetical protein